jgi:hypothetical protein
LKWTKVFEVNTVIVKVSTLNLSKTECLVINNVYEDKVNSLNIVQQYYTSHMFINSSKNNWTQLIKNISVFKREKLMNMNELKKN